MAVKKKAVKTKNALGRPSKLDDLDFGVIELLASKGFTDVQMSKIIGVSEVSFNAWKKKNTDFLKSLKDGKDYADSKVEYSLYERACGYEHKEEKIFLHEGKIVRAYTTKKYPPDTAAAFIWLKNRQGWKDKQDVEHSGKLSIVEQITKAYESKK